MPPEKKNQKTSDLRKDVIATFTTEPGEKVLRWLVKRCDFDSTVRQFDPYEAMFREGRRSVIVDILTEMRNPLLTNLQELVSELEQPSYEYAETADA